MMQREILRQTDVLRNFEASYATAQESSPMIYANHLQEPGPPLSPRQMPNPDIGQRRPSYTNIMEAPRQSQQQTPLRPPVASHLTISPRRYGSIGSNQASYSPSSGRAPPPPPPPTAAVQAPQSQQQHPLATVSSPPTNLPRRHTSADIRLHGWVGAPSTSGAPSASAYASSNISAQWPSSPLRAPPGPPPGSSDQALRDSLASYDFPRGPSISQNRATPPPPGLDPIAAVAGTGPDSAWAVPGSRYPYNKQLDVGGSNPPTRRSSMASNIHGILNPTGEHPDEDLEAEATGPGKRKRVA
jgi:hypothetical protein